MEIEPAYSETYEQALRMAVVAHNGQKRKGSGLPYIIHPIHVSVILLRHGFSTEAATAGLLHDIVEDQGYELGEITERFGARVAEIVEALSERKRDAQGKKRPWKVRKREGLQKIQQANRQAVAVKAADALHNAESFVEDLRREGPRIWQHFNKGPEPQLGYYREIVEIGKKKLGSHPLVVELDQAVQDLARAIKETGP
ncbi:MAG: bifunctional (p)ppGpp synthetase/guanosine-3',5'-bis(diphosphate) 3'-pyrophosphohydrolase [Anaerolineae bacterium]|nr:bifunctional (p)ppGpp synthetase/guanosine-3',5'-bis(diphosphate) 3'-pyrophosphohydrolase [Anaerolineae bacterium]